MKSSSYFWPYVLLVKSKVKISQNFVAFSEYMNFNLNQSLLSGIAEEVSEFNPGPASQNEPRITSMITNLKGLINGNSSQQFTTLTCRSIRVGSYKILTKERVFFTEKAIYLKVIEYYFFLISSISRLFYILTKLQGLPSGFDSK